MTLHYWSKTVQVNPDTSNNIEIIVPIGYWRRLRIAVRNTTETRGNVQITTKNDPVTIGFGTQTSNNTYVIADIEFAKIETDGIIRIKCDGSLITDSIIVNSIGAYEFIGANN